MIKLKPRITPEEFSELLSERILVFDGAMGTTIQNASLTVADYGGEAHEGCLEQLVVTRPDLIGGIHAAYLEAGADVVETDTLGGTPLVLGEFDLSDQAFEINRAAAALARETAVPFDTPDHTRYVAGSIGSTTRSLSLTGGITFDELIDQYTIQIRGLVEGGADILLLETALDTLNLKAGLIASHQVMAESGVQVPIMVSCTIESMGTTLAGQSIEAVFTSLEHARLSSIGINCATGPDLMTDHVRVLSALADIPVSVMPNAGLPDPDGGYSLSPEEMASTMERFITEGWVNIIGGCCGTTPDHIRLLAGLAAHAPPRIPARSIPAAVSGIDQLPLDDYTPVMVGERTNVIGSRAFKRLIGENDLDGAAEIARKQVREGAHVVDICLADPDRDEVTDMDDFLQVVTKKIRVPLMIDTTDDQVLETAMKRSQGKVIVNSINLEDGLERFERVAPLIHRYGGAVVIGCIDEDPDAGMARTRDRKLSIALRSHELLTGQFGLPERDLIFDPLVFPVGTGDPEYTGVAIETIEGVKAIKEALPACRTILGISNVSFGLPPAAREVVNAVFLHMNLQSGLDMAIVNTERLLRVTQIEEEERRLAEDLILNRSENALDALVDHFRDAEPRNTVARIDDLSVEERLSRYVIEGYRDGLEEDLEEMVRTMAPLDIINGPLMNGIAEVGRLFRENELIVAEVLQSAESMKAAVSWLEPRMEQGESASRGTLMLATVKGDVHDIGKNLVDIILSNNGYRVVNLGIKVPPGDLIRAVEAEQPDLIGLSGLLVKSTHEMTVTARELRTAGIDIPILVGGAALTRTYTTTKIAPEYDGVVQYARDAMEGLALADRLMDPEIRQELTMERSAADPAGAEEVEGTPAAPEAVVDIPPGGGLDHDFPLVDPVDLRSHTLEGNELDLEEIFSFINPAMLYGKHLGLKGKVEELFASGDTRAVELRESVEEIQKLAISEGIIAPRGVYRFFRSVGEGEDVVLLDASGRREEGRFTFSRQAKSPHRCLADYVRPREREQLDTIALFVVTAGHGIMEPSAEWKDEGQYFRSHTLQALALETAEAFAEWLHRQIRGEWGIEDDPEISRTDIFKAKYRGCRYSFGYPACPRLEDQEQLFHLLDAGRSTGVTLTETMMMDPEASVSAIVFHHPAAEYFSV